MHRFFVAKSGKRISISYCFREPLLFPTPLTNHNQNIPYWIVWKCDCITTFEHLILRCPLLQPLPQDPSVEFTETRCDTLPLSKDAAPEYRAVRKLFFEQSSRCWWFHFQPDSGLALKQPQHNFVFSEVILLGLRQRMWTVTWHGISCKEWRVKHRQQIDKSRRPLNNKTESSTSLRKWSERRVTRKVKAEKSNT